jgi:CHAD domain-containing protein
VSDAGTRRRRGDDHSDPDIAFDLTVDGGTDTATSTDRAGTPREVELKYLVRDVEALRAWLAQDWGGALDGVEATEARSVEVEDRYLDTAYGALDQAGFGARLRREDSGPVTLTVKSTSRDRPASPAEEPAQGSAALSQRIEVEGPAGGRLDPDEWPPSAARELVDELRAGARLRVLFTIEQRRERRTLALDDGPVLVTLDWVAVFRGGRPLAAFSVLEVETAGGSLADLRRLATLLEGTGYVTPEPRSKEEMARQHVARAMKDPAHRLPRVPTSPGVLADDPLAEAGRKVLRMHLARMLQFEGGTRSGEDAEDLHKMRVATRRMRAVWRTFDGAYRPKVTRRYVGELRAVARALGEVRDLDVLLEHLDDTMAGLAPAGRDALEPLRLTWRRQRESARTRLIERLDSRQYRELVDDYLAFTESPGAGAVATPMGQPSLVRDTAGSRVLAAYEHLRAYDTLITWADVSTLHALRIEAKRLRYALEAFSEVMPTSSRQLIATVTKVQDHLGLLNDADVAATAIRAWLNLNAPHLPATSRDAVGLYLDAREADAERLRRSFRPQWRRITGLSFRRLLGGTIARIG